MKRVHFIGICGVAMGGLAIAFKKAGFKVTGSDAGFFPPVSTNLEKHGVEFYPGWHPEKMGTPDLVIVGNVASSTNPEWQYTQENKLNYKSYPEAIEEFFVKENSIVCAGTYGKTTTSALLSFVLTECDYNPSYMFGGIAVDNFDSANLTDSKYSVLEGDEYKSSKWDNGAKFFHYHPTHLLLTATIWDHADVYPTEQSYFEAFDKLIKSVPEKGLIVVNERIKNIESLSNCTIVTYGHNNGATYQWDNISISQLGIKFEIKHQNKIFKIESPIIGEYNIENICGVFAVAHQIGIEPENIIAAIQKFKGLKRRLEKRYEDNKITIFDDIAHSPTKAKSVLENLRQIYTGKIICVFEPNTGNRQPQSEPGYADAFMAADEVIIPTLTKLKTSEELQHWNGAELAKIIQKTHNKVIYIEEDKELINYLFSNTQSGDVIVFCGSHGFRGMIEELIKQYAHS